MQVYFKRIVRLFVVGNIGFNLSRVYHNIEGLNELF